MKDCVRRISASSPPICSYFHSPKPLKQVLRARSISSLYNYSAREHQCFALSTLYVFGQSIVPQIPSAIIHSGSFGRIPQMNIHGPTPQGSFVPCRKSGHRMNVGITLLSPMARRSRARAMRNLSFDGISNMLSLKVTVTVL